MKIKIFILVFTFLQIGCYALRESQQNTSEQKNVIRIAQHSKDDFLVIPHDQIKSEINLATLMRYDTLIFSKEYTFDDFITLLYTTTGKINLYTIPDHNWEHLIPINEGKIDYKFKDVQAGNYLMDLFYGFENKDNKRIKKVILVK